MTNFKIRAILQGTVKYRDGKKFVRLPDNIAFMFQWKRRYCLLALSPGTSDALHLYVTKSYDEFAPYRNSRCLVDMEPPIQKGYVYQRSTISNEPSHKPLERESCNSFSQPRIHDAPKPLVNTAAHSCLLAAEATTKGLSLATNLATRLNAPVPIDEITGFESGCHLDKESNVIVLIGISSVHIIALEAFDEMFRWAGAMTQIMTDSQFRVTLRKSSEGSKLPQGTQGSLHVQHWRLCLIGEPLAGCKFICSWKLDSIEKAYTMTLPATNVCPVKSGTAESHGPKWSFSGDVSQRTSVASLSGFTGHMTSASVGSQPPKPKQSFILEASNSAGKGRGTHTFELEGGSLVELTTVIEQFMARRYYPDRDTLRESATKDPFPASVAVTRRGLTLDPNVQSSAVTSLQAPQPHLSSSPDGWGSRHSVSPAQNFARTQQQMTAQPSPLSMPTGFAASGANIWTGLDTNVYRRSAQTLPSNRFAKPSGFYSNLIPCASSLSPPDFLTGADNHTENSTVHLRTKTTGFDCPQAPFYNFSQRSTEPAVDYGIPFEEVMEVCDTSHVTSMNHTSTLANARDTSTITSSLSRKSFTPRSIASCAPSVRTPLSGYGEMDDETQVARVAAGLIIPKILASPLTQTTGRLKRPVVSNEPPLLSSKGLLRRVECEATEASVTHPDQFRGSTLESNPCYTSPRIPDPRSLPTSNQMPRHKPSTRPVGRRSEVATKNATSKNVAGRPESDVQNHELSPVCCFTQHGVFTADEDLWDAEQCDPSRGDLTDSALQHPPVQSKSNQQVLPVASNPKLLSSKDLAIVCQWCGRKKGVSDNAGYQVYRHRCQQYRVCWCHTYVGRSLSADALLLLDIIVSDQYERFLSLYQNSLLNDRSERPSEEMKFPFEPVRTQPMTCPPRYSISLTSRQLMSKTCGAIRWKQLHRLFHRKQSKSHDNIDRECNCLGSTDIDKKPVFSSSMTEAELGFDACPSDLDFKPQSADPHKRPDADPQADGRPSSLKSPPRLSIRCPRHGLLFYPPLVRSSVNSPIHLPLCSRCRKRKRHRAYPPPDCTNSTKAEVSYAVPAHRFPAVTVPSVSAALRTFVHLRQKSRESGPSVAKIGSSRKIAVGMRDSHTRSAITQPVPEGVEFEVQRPSVHSTQSPVDACPPRPSARPQLCLQHRYLCDNRLHCHRSAHSALSLTSLPCSEPALSGPRIPFGCMSEFDTRSSRSSLSSLLTFRSISGSSSLISACHGRKLTVDSSSQQHLEGTGRGLQRDTRDLSEEIGNCSLCDDELSSGSISACYEDPYSSHERRMVEPFRTESTAKNFDVPQSPLHTRPRHSDLKNRTCNQDCGTVVGHDNVHFPWGRGTRSWSQSKSGPYPKLSDQVNPAAGDHASLCFASSGVSSNCHSCIPDTSPTIQPAQRANTLPSTKVFRSNSERKPSDPKVAHSSEDASASKCRLSKDSKTLSRAMQPGIGLDRFLPRFARRGCHTRYNTANIASNAPDPVQLSRKLSSQSDLGLVSHSLDDFGGTAPGSARPFTEPTSYCNITPVQHSSTNYRLELPKHESTQSAKIPTLRSHQSESSETNSNLYVNLSVAVSRPSGHSSSGRGTKQLLQNVRQSVVSSRKGVTSTNTTEPSLQSSSLPSTASVTESRPVRTSCGHVRHPSVLEGGFPPSSVVTDDQVYTLNLSVGIGSSDLSNLPAEVRDPSRNYAMVDLRPSPASSSHVHTELTVSSVHQAQHHALRFDELTSTASSTGSTIAFSNSTSTGSDCTNDAATLTSDTVGNYAAVYPVTTSSSEQTESDNLFTSMSGMCPKQASRRRHSHSLSSAISEAPLLNYVDVITSTAPFISSDSSRRVDPTTLSDPSGSSIPEHTDSLSSSSGLGGIASQSITPPLAPGGSASFGDIFTSRSMTSSATSSGEGAAVDHGFHSCSPPDSSCVAYTQIDISRTMALEQLSGDIEQENVHISSSKQSGTGAQSHPWGSSKTDRSASVRKTLSRPIRSIRRGNQKKTGGFFS
ncbi:hypothetical protein T265_11640 [Opisthorchis viverrini]|uniref:IRS-type PTB domain-containing protein n=1 Tax=Opisthorchis viverrini TaxID=6198 RepID=A0A074YY96_OPIVI|nr:hypothetical protein T265_11640 [Opisthorchis viverrini]KER19643.1 hypothetical protein T265_11640 [Opisthorchis viverrini]